MQTVSWPTRGDHSTFKRRTMIVSAAGSASIISSLTLIYFTSPSNLVSSIPLFISASILLALWAHTSARSAARRVEVERSFAGLQVVHHGDRFNVNRRNPILGEYSTRRDAARAALNRGRWALVVKAWDRYYLLRCAPAKHAEKNRFGAVAFRSRAVSDVVPALLDEKIA